MFTFVKRGYTVLKNESEGSQIFWYETKDLLAGAVFPLMLQLILSVSFIGMATSITTDIVLSVIMLIIGEAFVIAAYAIFGRQSGIVSVRKLVQNAKKREIGTTDKQALFATGEYAAYKGFLMGFLSCVPYIIFQLIELCAHNSFCYFVLQYVFGWAVFPFQYAGLSGWFNFILVLLPTAVHGIVYIIAAHREWDKQQNIANMQNGKDKKSKK